MGTPSPDPVYREIIAWRAQRDAEYLIPVLQAAAREGGYAIGVHGSLRRDIDLIACPWIDGAESPADLYERLRQAVERAWRGSGHAGRIALKSEGDENPTLRPHGRECWVIHLGEGVYVDLSIMPRNPHDRSTAD